MQMYGQQLAHMRISSSYILILGTKLVKNRLDPEFVNLPSV